MRQNKSNRQTDDQCRLTQTLLHFASHSCIITEHVLFADVLIMLKLHLWSVLQAFQSLYRQTAPVKKTATVRANIVSITTAHEAPMVSAKTHAKAAPHVNGLNFLISVEKQKSSPILVNILDASV